MAHELRAGEIGHEAPLDLHHRKSRAGRGVADVRAERDLETAAEGHAMHRSDHRDVELTPKPGAALRAVGDAVRAHREIAHAGHLVTLSLHGGEASHVETGAEGLAFAGENDAAQAFHFGELGARFDDGLEHRGIQRIHLVGADQADVGGT